MLVDFFTKPLVGALFKKFRNIIQGGINQENTPKYKRNYYGDKGTYDQLVHDVAIANMVNHYHN